MAASPALVPAYRKSHMTLPDPTEGKSIAIQKLDAEIQRLTEQLCRVKAQRNTLTISYTIPPEVLGEIFLIVQAKRKSEVSPDPFHVDVPFLKLRSWLPITHVSQHWRTVASDCAELWCEIDVLPAAAISEFLVRSRGYHLSVDITAMQLNESLDVHSWDSQCLIADIFAHTHRIQKLSIRSAKGIRLALRHITLMPAPKLKELTLAADQEEVSDIPSVSDDTLLFQGITPQLEFLSLISCHISLNSPLFTANLTSLMISSMPEGYPTDWLNILRQLPRLSTLKLRYCFKDSADSIWRYTPIPEAYGVVHIPHLSQLNIGGIWLESELDFLSHISFPCKTKVDFLSGPSPSFTNSEDVGKSPLQSFLRVHNKARCNPSKMCITGIRLEESTGSNHTTDIWTDPLHSLEFSVVGESGTLLNVTIGRAERESFDETHLAAITSLPMSSVTSLTTNWDISPDMWKAISDWFPNLERIECGNGVIKQFFEALGARHADFDLFLDDILRPGRSRRSQRARRRRYDSDDEASDVEDEDEEEEKEEPTPEYDEVLDSDVDTTNTLFKLLKTIHIAHNSRLIIEKAVIRALTTRRKSGLPVKVIHFENCPRIMEEWASMLKTQGLVEEVSWVQRDGDNVLPSTGRRNTRDVPEIEDSDDMEF